MSRRRRTYTVIFGAMGGYLVGLTSIGSGSVMAVILLLLYPIAPAVLVGTGIPPATVLSLVGGLPHTAPGKGGRSGEPRGGEECRSRGWPDHLKKKYSLKS